MIRTILFLFAALFLTAADSAAHPMGNFSINHYSGLEIGPAEVRVRYILDLAEIPTFEEIEKSDSIKTASERPGGRRPISRSGPPRSRRDWSWRSPERVFPWFRSLPR